MHDKLFDLPQHSVQMMGPLLRRWIKCVNSRNDWHVYTLNWTFIKMFTGTFKSYLPLTLIKGVPGGSDSWKLCVIVISGSALSLYSSMGCLQELSRHPSPGSSSQAVPRCNLFAISHTHDLRIGSQVATLPDD